MEILEFIKDNFFGASYEDQKIIYDNLVNSLNELKIKKLSKEFKGAFEDYFDRLTSLLSFEELYRSFNSDKRRLTRRLTLEALIEQAEEHHIDNSNERRAQHFVYSSEEFTAQCKREEYMRYFKPKNVTPEGVQQFLVAYSGLDAESKREFVEDMILYYDRLRYFRLPVNDIMLQRYRPIIQDLLGEELMTYYDSLYPEEQMRLVIQVVDDCIWFKYDEEYYNRKNEEMKKDPKFIRRLKKEALNSCQSNLKRK